MFHLPRLHHRFFLHCFRNRNELHWPIFDQNTDTFLNGMVTQLLKICVNRFERYQATVSKKYWQEKYVDVIRLIRLKVVNSRNSTANGEFLKDAIGLHAV